jgi:hypothetical protein
LGDIAHSHTFQIGTAFPYFQWADNSKSVARISGKTWYYWTRSPGSNIYVRCVYEAGEFEGYLSFAGLAAYGDFCGVRPVLNLKADVLVVNITADYGTSSLRPEEDKGPDNDPKEAEKVTNEESPLEEIRFFSDTGDRSTYTTRNYGDRFPVNTYYICWDYIYKHPAYDKQVLISTTHEYYDSDGNLLDKQAYGDFIMVGTTESLLTGGCGQLSDYIFSPGLYRVDLYMSDLSGSSEEPRFVSGFFTAY